MKQKILYLLVMFLTCCVTTDLFAQEQQTGKKHLSYEQRIEKQAQNISQSLMLSDPVSEKFTSLYVQYLKELRSSSRSDFPKGFNKEDFSRDKITDEQIDKLIQLRFDKCRIILDIREKYYSEFKKILSPRQIMKMYSIERSFGKKMQGELEKRHNKKMMKR